MRLDAERRRLDPTRVASAYFLSWYCLVPSGTSFRGLNVRVFPLSKESLVREISGPMIQRGEGAYRPKKDDMVGRRASYCHNPKWQFINWVGDTVLFHSIRQ